MPSVFYGLEWKNLWLAALDKKLESEKINPASKNNDSVKYKTFSTISEYKNFLAKNINNLTGEIYLIPSTWADDFVSQAQNFVLDHNSTALFHYSTTDLVKETKLGMIPYAIDMPVLLVQNIDQTIGSAPKIEDIKNILLLNKKSSESLKFFPISFGIDSQSLWILQKWWNVFEGYENSLQLIFDLISKTSNINMLKALQEFGDEKSSLYRTYSLSWINNWLNAYSKAKSSSFPDCKTYKALCLLQSDKTNIVFWNLSDLDILQAKFDKKPEIFPFFQAQGSYPVVTWYLMIRKDLPTTKQTLAIKYFKTYMDMANGSDTSFWNNTLSPINNALETQRYKTQYENILGWMWSMYSVRWSLNSVKNIVSNKDMENFLKTWDWINDAMKTLIWD